MNIIKPLSAFQYYIKEWKHLSNEDKRPFELMALRDKKRYEEQMYKKELEEDEEVKKFHEELDQKNKPIIKEVGKFGDKDWSISIGDVDE